MPVDPDERFTLFEHLDELRKRIVLVRSSPSPSACSSRPSSTTSSSTCSSIRSSRCPASTAAAYKITTFSPTEPFMVSLKVWVVAGLIMASPFLIWQLWAFVGPAFTSTEKRYFYPVVIATMRALPRRRRLRLPRRAAQGPRSSCSASAPALQRPEPGHRLLHLRGPLHPRLRRRLRDAGRPRAARQGRA